jgi:hypothetical protein
MILMADMLSIGADCILHDCGDVSVGLYDVPFTIVSDLSTALMIDSLNFLCRNLIQIFYIPLDYITLSVALWNFVIVGLVSIFWKGPLWLQQAYLTVLSSLMVK